MPPREDEARQRLKVAKELLAVFRMERIAYLVTTLAAVLFLLVVATILVFKESYVLSLGMFAASGVITYSIGRLLHMWNQILTVIFGPIKEVRE